MRRRRMKRFPSPYRVWIITSGTVFAATLGLQLILSGESKSLVWIGTASFGVLLVASILWLSGLISKWLCRKLPPKVLDRLMGRDKHMTEWDEDENLGSSFDVAEERELDSITRIITGFLKDKLLRHGADLVGFGDLTGLPAEVREGLPVGVCVAVKYPKEVIRGIAELPTREYYGYYDSLNEKLDGLVTLGAEALKMLGYQAIAKTREQVACVETEYQTLLPHKTVASRAGIGWIGKCALLVTPQYGSMVRISSILTDAPLQCAEPIDESRCGECMECTKACPGGAVSGRLWNVDTPREAFYDAIKCRKTARARALQSFGVEISQCGKCIEVCPYTKRYLDQED